MFMLYFHIFDKLVLIIFSKSTQFYVIKLTSKCETMPI